MLAVEKKRRTGGGRIAANPCCNDEVVVPPQRKSSEDLAVYSQRNEKPSYATERPVNAVHDWTEVLDCHSADLDLIDAQCFEDRPNGMSE